MDQNAQNLDLAVRCETLKEYCNQLDAISRAYLLRDELVVVSSYIYQATLKLKAAIQTMEAEMRQ